MILCCSCCCCRPSIGFEKGFLAATYPQALLQVSIEIPQGEDTTAFWCNCVFNASLIRCMSASFTTESALWCINFRLLVTVPVPPLVHRYCCSFSFYLSQVSNQQHRRSRTRPKARQWVRGTQKMLDPSTPLPQLLGTEVL